MEFVTRQALAGVFPIDVHLETLDKELGVSIRKGGIIWSFLLPALAGTLLSWQGNRGVARRRTSVPPRGASRSGIEPAGASAATAKGSGQLGRRSHRLAQ